MLIRHTLTHPHPLPIHVQVVRAGSLRLILDEFEAVSETRGFVEHMGLRLLVDILDKDEVRVKSESVVFEAAVRWLSAPGRERAGGEPAQRVLQRVRYPLMNSEYLLRRVAHCEEAGVKGSEAALKELVSEALLFKSTRADDGEAVEADDDEDGDEDDDEDETDVI